ncbi:sensor histidine kinase [Oceaniglobus roseus]|uniref:sensor histidine kinase n=1 Tax=Oceaniglobus roseus TaxID=1737570 RepID=UPI000C7E97E9|nr:HAMP domain-containing sensor histidine kinase [Kandeliimicrobium roseum]
MTGLAPRSTPLRLALVVIGVFVLFLAAGLTVAYATLRGTLTEETAGRLEQIVSEIAVIPEAEERIERVRELAAAADPERLLISYAAEGMSAGNVAAPRFDGYGSFGGDDLGRGGERAERYAGWSGTVGGGRLTVLVGQEALAELNAIFAAILGLSVVPATLLTSAIGLVAARRAGARVDAIRTTLGRLRVGDLAARVPPGRAGAPDLDEIAADLDRMAEARQAATEALRQVSSDIAHDLRTPIQRVAVLLERLSETLPDGEAAALADRARDATAGVIETFRVLLQIAQLEGGQGRGLLGPVDLGALLRDITEVYTPAAEESGHAIDLRIEDPVPVLGDRTLLSRLVANLVENALKHTPGGRIALALRGTELTVRDEGPGIPEAEHAAVLRRLYRRESSRTTPGSGLGLALVKAVTDLHGAELALSDAGPGLKVTVRLQAHAA